MNKMMPKYYIIKQDITTMINKGELQPNCIVPSETELMKKYSVSRITARRALDELSMEGYLYKIQGKGTFVKEEIKKQTLSSVQSYTEEILRQGMIPSRKVFSSEIQLASEKIASALEINHKESVFFLERVYYADNLPLCYTKATLPYRFFKDIDKIDFSQCSLYDVIENKYDIKIVKSFLNIKAVAAFDKVAERLETSKGTPVLLFSASTNGIVDEVERPIEVFSTYYLTDHFSYILEQSRI
ncbi:GntR family transcriptional regulator [Natronincola ferrireducens]|uniref:GntR family transcriptional regulator n=1 Tax=Natronincola ferrireducens TaxID=393762 RepID=A0A1G9HJI4_9FIRM|nr:GntR family transcriptional regulator [Natronincola ferrireducens]SDL13045.1 GntR family transcriptional regulator [Natronincola ferrireducens]